MTPFEAYSGRKPEIAHLKVSGSIFYVHVPLNLRHKLECKSPKCIFVGYDTSEKRYRVFDPITKKTILSRDVVFDENGSWNWEANFEKYFSVPITADIAEIELTQTPKEQEELVSCGIAPTIPQEELSSNIDCPSS
ncbi:hypothetical protein EV2_019953 [Malus domestica]